MNKFNREGFNWFDTPTQVAFIEPNEFEDDVSDLRQIGGIAYRNEIICLECGGTIDIEELFESWKEIAEEGYEIPFPICIYSWVSLNEECLGDMEN